MRRPVIVGLCALLAAGCSSTRKVVAMGPDTFSVSSTAARAATARTDALEAANAHCQSLNKQLLVTNIETATSNNAPDSADIIFRCLPSNDPELHRPSFERAPDVLVKNR